MLQDQLTSAERALFTQLLKHLKRPFRLTSVPQAARSPGLLLDNVGRLRSGDCLACRPDLSLAPRRRGTPAFALTDGGKLLGRALQLAGCPVSVAEIGAQHRIEGDVVQRGLRTLVGLGLAEQQHYDHSEGRHGNH